MRRLLYPRSVSLLHLLLFLSLLANIGCQKELSQEGLVTGGAGGTSSGSAQYTLVPAGSNCSDAVTAGVFEAGKDLGIDAVMTVTVNVTQAGDWTYATAIADGFSFVGSGNFTTTGNQVITLQAVGKPTSAGNFNFALKVGGVACLVAVPVAPAGSGGSTSTADFYYKATIGGTNYNQDVTSTNGYFADEGVDGTTDVTFGGGISYSGATLPATGTEFGVTKGIMHNFTTATQAQFKAFFAPGNYPFASYNLTTGVLGDGIGLFWVEPGGNDMWITGDGATMQSGSTFKIVSTTDAVDAQNNYYLKVKVQFSCKFYSVSTGVSKTVTNGEAVVKFAMQ